MAFESATRRAILAEAGDVAARVARIDQAALGDVLDTARAALRRTCALGQGDGGAARAGALAALACAAHAACGVRAGPHEMAAALGMYLGHAVQGGHGSGAPLAVALCAALHVWSGRPCHVVCASDLAAARDAATFEPLFFMTGCSSAALAPSMARPDAERAHASDVVYASARQLLSDSMRDQMLQGGSATPVRRRAAAPGKRAVMAGTGVAIVADIEAVLADDASTPVMLSAPGQLALLGDASQAALGVVAGLAAPRDYRIVAEPAWQVHFTPAGEARMLELAATILPPYWRTARRCLDLVGMALLARDVIERERHYQVQEGRVMIADDNLLRLLAGRTWHQGPLQAIEAREQLAPSAPPRTVARAAFQSYFPRYQRIGGIGASLAGLGGELRACYGLALLDLALAHDRAPAAPLRRYDFADRQAKLDGFVDAIAALAGAGGAVLAGAPRSADLAAIGRALSERQLVFHLADGRDPQADEATLGAGAAPGRVTLVVGAAVRGARPAAGMTPLLFEHWDTVRADRAFFAHGAGGSVFAARAELAVRPLPLWAVPLRWAVRARRTGPALGAALVSLSQWHVARASSRYRQGMAAREAQLDEQLAFSRKA